MITAAVLVAVISNCSCPQKNAGSFSNPVIRSDAADPTFLAVDGAYYAVGSSYQWTPAYPIYKSEDMVNWTQVGNVLDSKPEWADGGFWAPELLEHNGRYYCYYSPGRRPDGKHCLAFAVADRPEGPYTDQGIIYDEGTEQIDAHVFDDNGQLYITWKAHGLDKCPIECQCSRLADDGRTLEGEPFCILRDDERIGMEGQVIFKEGGYYYILYSARGCCGPRSNYEVRVARATSIEGEWEKYDGNPILMGGPDNPEVISIGHGSVIQVDSRIFYLCHAYTEGEDFNLGRCPFLHELEVTEDGWIRPVTGKYAVIDQPTPFPGTVQKVTNEYVADFIRPRNNTVKAMSEANAPFDVSWTRPNVEVKEEAKFAENSSRYDVQCQRPFSSNYDVTITAKRQNPGEETGLIFFGNYNNVVTLTVTEDRIILKSLQANKEKILREWPLEGGKRAIELTASVSSGTAVTFSWNSGRQCGRYDDAVDVSYLRRWDSTYRVGMVSTSRLPGSVSTFVMTAR